MNNAFILCNLFWKVHKSLAANRESSFEESLLFIKATPRSLVIVWLFWTFQNKSNNIKALVILNDSWSPCLHSLVYMGKKKKKKIHCSIYQYNIMCKEWGISVVCDGDFVIMFDDK